MASLKTPGGEFSMKNEDLFLLGLVGFGLVWLLTRNAGAVTQALTNAAVNAAGGAVAGTATGIGQQLGIPATDAAKCSADLAAGNYWQASFDCPVGTFVGGVLGNNPTPGTLQGLRCARCGNASCPGRDQGAVYDNQA